MQKLLLKNCNILNGKETMSLQEDMDILIEGNKISKIGKNINVKAKVIDCQNKFILPGLINLHVHLPASGKLSKKKASDTKNLIKFIKSNSFTRKIGVLLCKNHAKEALLSGVTTIRTVGGVANFDSIVRDKINEGKYIGPRIFSCDEAIGVKGGHMDGTVAVAANNINEAIELVEQRKRDGADWIKLMITGGVLDCKEIGHPGELRMSAEMVKACSDKAHELGLKVCAHVEGPEGIEIAIKNGVDTIEHGSSVSDDLLDEFAKRGGALVQTISAAAPFIYLDPSKSIYGEVAKINSQVVLNNMLDMVSKCIKHNIPVGLGTDVGCPYVTNSNFYNEILYSTKLIKGMTPICAIHHATEVNAQILGISDKIGTIEEGKLADILIVDDNPLNNLYALGNPILVIKDGIIYKGKRKKYKDIDIKINEIMSKIDGE